MDGQDGIVGIMAAAQNHFQFRIIHQTLELLNLTDQVGFDIFSFSHQLLENLHLFSGGGQVFSQFNLFLQAGDGLQGFLGLFVIVPEVGV